MKTNFYALVLLCALANPSFGQAPVINSLTGPSAVCSSPAIPSSFTVSASNSPVSYGWSVSPSASVIIGAPGVITAISFPNTNSTYTISCIAINGSGASNIATYTVAVFETPTVTFSGNNVFCQGSSTNLSASSTLLYSASSALSYTWSPSTGLNTTSGPNVTANPTVTTTYTIDVALGFCANTYQQTATVNIPPTVTAAINPTMICVGQSANLTIGGTASQYFKDFLPATPGTNAVSPAVSATYTISGRANGCETFTTVSIIVSPCVGFNNISADAIEKLNVYPNPSNGTFIVKSPRSESMLVTNELGQVIRHMALVANEETEVRELPAGVYFIITAGAKSKLIVTH